LDWLELLDCPVGLGMEVVELGIVLLVLLLGMNYPDLDYYWVVVCLEPPVVERLVQMDLVEGLGSCVWDSSALWVLLTVD